MPRKSPFPIVLSADEQKQLEKMARHYTSPYFEVVRAKIVLLAAQSLENRQIGQRLDLPRQIVSRADMAVFMARAMGWITLGDDMTTTPDLFNDVLAGFWAGTAIQACVAHGVVLGYPDGFFQPTWDVSRDQMTVFLGRTYGY